VVAPPFITPDGLVFVADQTGKVVEFQATGQPVANPFYNAGAAILAAPVALNGSFYAVDATGQLHIVSLANPTQATKVKVASATTPLQSPLVFGNRLYVGDVDGTFHAVDITNPAAGITTLALQDGATSSPAVAFGPSGTLSDAVVAVATADGSIVALPLL
jgi:outer membrane protein assembly factor BamB